MANIEKYQLKDGTWKYRARTRIGGRGSKKISGKVTNYARTAKEKAKELEDSKVLGNPEMKPQNTKILEVYQEYVKDCETKILRDKLSLGTLNHNRDHLKFFLEVYGDFKVSDFNHGVIKKYKKILEEVKSTLNDGSVKLRFSTNGINIKMRAIRTLMNWATEEKYFIQSPTKGIEMDADVDVGRFLTDDEIYAVLDQGCKFNRELLEILMVFLYTGMRLTECVTVTKEQIMDGQIYIERKRNKNKKKPKMIPILKPIDYIFNRIKRGAIFPGWTQGRVSQAFRRAYKRAGIAGRVRIHDLRHTCASFLLRKGILTLEDVQKLLGHTNINTAGRDSHYETFYLKDKMKDVRFPAPSDFGAPFGAPKTRLTNNIIGLHNLPVSEVIENL